MRGGKAALQSGRNAPAGPAEDREPERLACRPAPSAKARAPPEADEDTSNGANRTLRPGRARAPGQSIAVAAPVAQRRENGTPSAASWERAHRVFCPKRRRRPQSGPPAHAKKESWDFSLGAHSAPSAWVRASPAWPRAVASRTRVADAGATELVAASDRRASRLEPQAHRARNTQSTHERRDLQEDRTRSPSPLATASRPAAPHANVPAFAPSTAPITSTPSPIPFLTSAASSLFCFASPLTHPLPRSHHPGLAPQFY